ncbi:hypothetical protein KSS87_010502 [Heliosperma pusillum]|nr:hypothetical protein KSS87_010502 [Heliosperma pusillum]
MASPRMLWDVAKKCFTAGLIGLAVSDRFGCVTHIRGQSMSPTLNPSNSTFTDYVLVEKICLRRYSFSLGDVIVLSSPTNHKEKNVKRIIALPGDWLRLPDMHDTVKIPAGHCWVEGDNSATKMEEGTRAVGLVMAHFSMKRDWHGPTRHAMGRARAELLEKRPCPAQMGKRGLGTLRIQRNKAEGEELLGTPSTARHGP